MSTLTPSRGLRGPVQAAVRQHRTALRIALAAVLAVALILIAYRFWTANIAADFAASGCTEEVASRYCHQKDREFSDAMSAYHRMLQNGSLFIQVLPGLIGAFIAGPVIARELESGTYKLAWTQSVSPARWLASKLVAPAAAAIAALALLTAVHAWVSATGPETSRHSLPAWYETTVAASSGIIPVAYGLLGIAVGALAGLLVARTVPAMSVAFLATGALVLSLSELRPHLWPTDTTTSTATGLHVPGVDSQWVTQGYVMADGSRREEIACGRHYDTGAQCMADQGATGRYLEYHPAAHFWPLQLVETCVVLVLIAVCVFAAFKVLRRRHG